MIRNNIFAFSRLYQVQATRVEKHLSFTFEKNIVYWDTGHLLQGPWTKIRLHMRRNCYWNVEGGTVDFAGLSLDAWRRLGRGEGSIMADPLFVDPKGRDFRLKPGSPALGVGFKPFDFSRAGVYGDSRWVEKARNAALAP